MIAHTTTHLDAAILVSARSGTAASALRAALAGYPEVTVSGRAAFTAAQASALAGQSGASLTLDGVLLGYIMIAVVNSLVMATAARSREFALLRLIGSTRRQVRAMMRRETLVTAAAAAIIGALAAVPAVLGISVGLAGGLPTVPLAEAVGIVVVVAVVAWGAIMIPVRLALRADPAETLSARDT